MKNNKFFILGMLLLLAGACSDDDTTTGNIGDGGDGDTANVISFLLDEIVTSRVDVMEELFENGDYIGVRAYDSSYELYDYSDSYSYNSTDKSFEAIDPISHEEDELALAYVATYPAMSATSSSWSAYTDQSNLIKYELSDLLAAFAPATTSLTPSFTFYHAMSRVKINTTVYKDGVPYTYSDMQFHAKVKQALGSDYQSFTVAEDAAVVDITPLQIDDDSYMAIVASQTIDTEDFASVTFDGKTLTMYIEDMSTMTFEWGKSYTYDWKIEEYEGLRTQSLVLVETEIDNWGSGESLEDSYEYPITLDRTYDKSKSYVALSDGTITIDYTRSEEAEQADSAVTWYSDTPSVASVSGGVVTLKAFGEAKIYATCEGVTDYVTLNIPGGLVQELFNTSKTISTVSSTARPVTGAYIYGVDGNTKSWDSTNECLYITCSTNVTPSSNKSATVDGVSHSFTHYRRADLWCYNVGDVTFNPNTFPYLAYHLTDNVAANNGIYYQEFLFNHAFDASVATCAKPTLKSSDSYADSTYNSSVIYLSDGSLIVVFDMSELITPVGTVGSGLTDYITIATADMNYFMYGYAVNTEVDGDTYNAIDTNVYWNLYSVQTFASMADIATYYKSKGLSSKVVE